MRRSTFLNLAAVAGALAIVGCGSDNIRRFNARFSPTQADTGTVTMAVVSVERWQDVVGELKPQFQLTGDGALNKVLPITSALQEKILSSFGANVAAQLPTETLTRTESITKPDNAPRTTETETTERKTVEGTVPMLGALPGTPPANVANLPGYAELEKLASGFKNNPLIEYQAALALFQEVKLLNRYVEQAAGRHGFTPYLVRLQIGVTPYAHRQPYDVYTRIGFFSTVDPETLCRALGIADPQRRPEDEARCKDLAGRSPEIIPLVVTDDLELTRHSRTADVVRQLQAALAGTVQGVGLAGQLSSLNEQLQSIIGSSLNSLSSVTRLSDNTMQARLGAANDPSINGCTWLERRTFCRGVDRSMINRNYFVTMLMLIPEPLVAVSQPGTIRLIAHTDMRQITDGAKFPPQFHLVGERFLAQLKEYDAFLAPESKSTAEWSLERMIGVLAQVMQNDQAGFDQTIKLASDLSAKDTSPISYRKPIDAHDNRVVDSKLILHSLWTELAALAASFDLHIATIDLPRYQAPRLPATQIALVRDNPASGTASVLLQAAKGLTHERVSGQLTLITKTSLPGGWAPDKVYPFAATKVAVASDGSAVALSFPSLAKLGLNATNISRLEVELFREIDPRYESYTGGLRPIGVGEKGDIVRGIIRAQIDAGPDASSDFADDARAKTYNRQAPPAAATDYECSLYSSFCRYVAHYQPDFDPKVASAADVTAFVERISIKPNETTGTAKLLVTFKKVDQAPDKVALTVVNADLTKASVNGVAVNVAKNGLVVAGNPGEEKVVELELGQLLPNETVEIKARGTRGEIEVPVMPPKSLTVKAAPTAKQ